MIDLVFRDALVVDGTGGEPFRGDVAVSSGRIAAVAPSLGQVVAARTIDAAGLALMPGTVAADVLTVMAWIIESHKNLEAEIT